ncbi:hypothetical protein [Halomontanus rarus]|uniref:hypothetical protein n=1 Tax=Halomontanus rarus TaxID=3034020 RepID=UPI0023E8DC82|nr:hypothetical protein [Halovivax sp. TS33]
MATDLRRYELIVDERFQSVTVFSGVHKLEWSVERVPGRFGADRANEVGEVESGHRDHR